MADSSPHGLSAFPVIDFHAHALDPGVYAQCVNHNVITGFGLNPEGPRPQPGTLRDAYYQRYTSPAMHVEEMDALGVDIHVISNGGANSGTFWAEPTLAAALDRQANETIAKWVGAYPTRFVGMFSVPLQDIALAVKELEYAVGTLGLRVANLPAESKGVYLGDPHFRPLWEAISHYGVVVWIHPDGMKDKSYLKYALWNGVGQPIQETLVFCSLMYEGVLDAFPQVKIVLSHGGGFLPHYMARLDRNYTAHPISRKNLTRHPSEYLQSLYYDTCVYGADVLEDLVNKVGVDRIVLGSDYPVGDKDPFAIVRGCSNITSAGFELITRTTPAAILGLTRSELPLAKAS
ncbi:MAG: amidohydrolase family protein [Xanthobacteraceae bacterium]